MSTTSLQWPMLDDIWRHYRNPVRLWVHTASAPVLLVGLWLHSWPMIGAALAVMVVNPFLFGAVDARDGVMVRVMDGARIWLRQASPAARVLAIWLPSLIAVPLVWALWTNQVFWTAFFLLWAVAYKTAFCCMALELRGPAE